METGKIEFKNDNDKTFIEILSYRLGDLLRRIAELERRVDSIESNLYRIGKRRHETPQTQKQNE